MAVDNRELGVYNQILDFIRLIRLIGSSLGPSVYLHSADQHERPIRGSHTRAGDSLRHDHSRASEQEEARLTARTVSTKLRN